MDRPPRSLDLYPIGLWNHDDRKISRVYNQNVIFRQFCAMNSLVLSEIYEMKTKLVAIKKLIEEISCKEEIKAERGYFKKRSYKSILL